MSIIINGLAVQTGNIQSDSIVDVKKNPRDQIKDYRMDISIIGHFRDAYKHPAFVLP
jgi:hypothetical protein